MFYLIGLNFLNPDLKSKSENKDIKFELINKIVLNKQSNPINKENKKRCCK